MKELRLLGDVALYLLPSLCLPCWRKQPGVIVPAVGVTSNHLSFPPALIHVTNIPPSLPPVPHWCVPWIKCKLHQLHGKPGCSDGDYSLIWQLSVKISEITKRNCTHNCIGLLFWEVEVLYPPGDVCEPPCSMLLITWLENKWPEVFVIMCSSASSSGWN